jgi:MerR family mercuric resistance operon transcriptional regulator
MNTCLQDDKLIRLSALAEQTGLSVHTIRNYVDQGLVGVKNRTVGGLLLFDEPAIERLRFIKTARNAAIPLAKIVCLLTASDKRDEVGLTKSLTELNQTIQDTRRKLNTFEQSLFTIRDTRSLPAMESEREGW